jgi:hypothetical protein
MVLNTLACSKTAKHVEKESSSIAKEIYLREILKTI